MTERALVRERSWQTSRASRPTARRWVALWRAIHVQVDAAAALLEDEIGLKLAAPDERWRETSRHEPAFYCWLSS